MNLSELFKDGPDWAGGNCTDLPPKEADALFFGTEGVEQAQEYCEDCPLQAMCLAWGQKTHSEGVWGGKELTHGRVLGEARKPPGRPLRAVCAANLHRMEGDNLIVRPNGHRECRACKNHGARLRRAGKVSA